MRSCLRHEADFTRWQHRALWGSAEGLRARVLRHPGWTGGGSVAGPSVSVPAAPTPPRPRSPQFLLQDCASCPLSSAGHCGFLVPLQLRIRPNPERPRTAPAPPVPECLPGAFRQQTATAGVALVARERLPRTCSPLRLPRSTPDGHARPPGTFVNAASRRRHCFLLPSGPCLSRLVPDTPLTHSPRRPKVPSFRLAPLTCAHALPAVPVSTLNLSKLPVLKRRAQDTHTHTRTHTHAHRASCLRCRRASRAHTPLSPWKSQRGFSLKHG